MAQAVPAEEDVQGSLSEREVYDLAKEVKKSIDSYDVDSVRQWLGIIQDSPGDLMAVAKKPLGKVPLVDFAHKAHLSQFHEARKSHATKQLAEICEILGRAQMGRYLA